jgi:hypothetical protein
MVRKPCRYVAAAVAVVTILASTIATACSVFAAAMEVSVEI